MNPLSDQVTSWQVFKKVIEIYGRKQPGCGAFFMMAKLKIAFGYLNV